MILNIILATIALVVFTQPNAGRTLAACIFGGATILYGGASGGLTGAEYYIGAAMVDLAIIVLLSGIYPAPRLVERLQWVCVASILLNFIGWVAWFFYIPPDAYNAAFIGLYIYAIYALLKKDKGDAMGGGAVHSWFTRFRSDSRARHNRIAKN